MNNGFVENSPIYSPSDIKMVIDEAFKDLAPKGNNKGVKYYNCPCAFDIETTSFYVDETGKNITYAEKEERRKFDNDYNPQKRATMYIWQMGLNGRVIIGRTWEEFMAVCLELSISLHLSEKNRIIIYVHNLAYEFQFISRLFQWVNVFSIDNRKPIYAISTLWIEFRCSYLLSGYSLSMLGKQLTTHKVKKMDGDLDYSLMRNSKTPLTDKELGYCVNDVRVVMAYIQEKLEQEGMLSTLPITKTGYVRQYCRKRCLYLDGHKQNRRYKELMEKLKINDLSEFDLLKRAFQGGFTHCNAYYMGERMKDVASYDFTSSYPYVMVSEKFPMSGGVKVKVESEEEAENYFKKYLAIFDVVFINLMPIDTNDNPLSKSKCYKHVNVVENNGRVVSADLVATSLTNIDFQVMKQFYRWDSVKFGAFYIYYANYLPTPLVDCILELYEKKTTLKGVEGMEVEYLKSKEMINSVYGMTVTNPLRDEIIFDGLEWETNPPENREELLEKYNNSRNRFLFYPWGIFVTSYARRNLFTGIKAVGDDYIYCDTDSIKFTNPDSHKSYFESYNKLVSVKLEKAMQYHGFEIKRTCPETKEGKKKPLGVWDFEGVYKSFKTLGAKRYMVEEDNALKVDGVSYPVCMTVSGVNKKVAIPYLWELTGGNTDKIFELFSEGLEIPPSKSGKNLHSYIDGKDEEGNPIDIEGTLTDYLGNEAPYKEKSCIHLEPTGYDLSIATLYRKYIEGIRFNI